MPDEPRLTLITRPNCHLCAVARDVVERVIAVTGDGCVELDITGDLEMERDYGERVPVVLLDGKEYAYWRVNEERLLRDLTAPRL